MQNKIIALVGRPNVGKSTLFNRLSNGKKAIVHDKPGVTRDRKYAMGSIGPTRFTIIDTPGLEEAKSDKIEYAMMQQTIAAIKEADIVCLMVDYRQGITPMDKEFANLIRQNSSNHILVINKCEKAVYLDGEYYKLGFDHIATISAEHNIGMMDLYEAINNSFNKLSKEKDSNFDPTDPQSPKEASISIAIVGRPNVGKSTFINALLKDQRLLTGPQAGLTRESIEIKLRYKDQELALIDTAGLRKKKVISEQLEKLSASDTISSIKFANIVVLMLEAEQALEQQDLIIANYVINEGRGLVIVINKSDLIRDKKKFQEELEYKLSTHLPHIKNVPIIFTCAAKSQNINGVLNSAIKTYELWNKKIPTSKLNIWLGDACNQHPLPLKKNGRRVKLKYITQIKSRPPTFKIFSNDPDKISDAYIRYLINNMRDSFDLPGIPLRLAFTKTKNPYAS